MRIKLLLTFALLLTAVTGAWANEYLYFEISETSATMKYGENFWGKPYYDERADWWINDSSWDGRENIKTITVDASCQNINQENLSGLFYEFTNLETITNIDKLNTANVLDMSRLFQGCSSLSTLDLSDWNTSKVTDMSSMFYGCTSLTTLNIIGWDTSNVTNTESMFNGCSSLASISFPASLTTIGDFAFQGCTSLATVTVYAPDCTLGDNAFDGCSNLTNIYVFSDLVSQYKTNWSAYASIITAMTPVASGECGKDNPGDVTWRLEGEAGHYRLIISGTGAMADYVSSNQPWNSDMGNIKTVVIGNGVTSIGNYAFYECSNLTSIEIPASVTSIGTNAFISCSNLATVTFASGSQLATIGNGAFYNCTNLTSIEIPANVTSIGDFAFSQSSGLTSIEIPASVTSIGDGAFANCSGLATVTFETGSQLTSIGEQVFYNCNSTGLTSIEIPSSVTSIGKSAFEYCSNLATVTFETGSKLTTIGNNAFKNSVLTSIAIPANVESIGNYAFNNSHLTSIEIPASVTTIGESAFQSSIGLTSVTLYASSCNLGNNAFKNCNNLTNIYVFSDLVDDYQAAWSTYAGKITAIPTVTTSYVDADGTLHDNVEAVSLNNAMTTLPTGTYVVNSDVTYTSTVTLSGDVTLILADGKTMSVTTTDNHECINADGHSLHIYGQTQGTGTLSAQIQGNADYVIYIKDGTLGIHGGNVYATVGSTETSIAIYLIRHNAGDAFIIDRGTVTANGNTGYGIEGFSGNYCINGGQVIAAGASIGIAIAKEGINKFNGVLILSGGTITASSFYTASDIAGGKYAGSIKVADGHIYYDEDENSYTAGTLTSEQITAIAGKTLRPVMGVVLTKDGSGNISAEFDGTSLETVSIPINITVNSVTLNRTFTLHKCATLMLPFSLGDGQSLNGGTLYKFDGVNNGEGDWVATLSEFTSPLKANTPYLIEPNGHMTDDKITFDLNGGSVTLNTTTAGEDSNEKDDLWDFIGTYSYIKWTSDTGDQDYSAEREAEIGKVYGFAAVEKTGIHVGDFVRVASGAKIRPMCAYLKWKGSIPNNARALTRAATNDDTELPQRITVKLVSASGETTAIGTLDTTTGEVSFDSEAWYTLDGVRLSGQPSTKGIYINNGKKIVIK